MRALLSSLGIVVSLGALGCDVCGCRPYGSSGDPLYNNTTSLGFQYRQSIFHSLHTNPFNRGESHISGEFFSRTTLVFNYSFNERWSVTAALPWTYNTIEDEGDISRSSSLGDMSVSGNYRLLGTDRTQPWVIDASLGIKLPTGSWDETDSDIPGTMLPGTGSVDVMAGIRGMYRHSEKWSALSDLSAKFNTANPEGLTYGPQYSVHLAERYRWLNTNGGLSSWIEGGYYFNLLTENHSSDPFKEAPASSGSFHMCSVSWITSWKSFSLSAQMLIPVDQDFAGGNVHLGTTAQIQMTYYF